MGARLLQIEGEENESNDMGCLGVELRREGICWRLGRRQQPPLSHLRIFRRSEDHPPPVGESCHSNKEEMGTTISSIGGVCVVLNEEENKREERASERERERERER